MLLFRTRTDWIESKRLANFEKHGIDFAEVAPMFEGWMRVTDETRQRYDPPRKVGIGVLGNRTIVIVWAETIDTRWRISARRANAQERKLYEASR